MRPTLMTHTIQLSGAMGTGYLAKITSVMGLAAQTNYLLKAARKLYEEMSADAVLLLTETDLDWDAVRWLFPNGIRLLIAAQDKDLAAKLQTYPDLTILDI